MARTPKTINDFTELDEAPAAIDKILIYDASATGEHTKAITVENLIANATVDAATTSAAGIVELATNNEAIAGASTSLAVTPAGLAAAIAAGSSSGDVTGPSSSTDNALVRFDSTTGRVLQNSTVIVSDAGDITARSIALTNDLPLTDGGTGASTASGARTNLGLGTAAIANTGTGAGNVVVLNGSAQLPAVDGSLLTNVIGSPILTYQRVVTWDGVVTQPTLEPGDRLDIDYQNAETENVHPVITLPIDAALGTRIEIKDNAYAGHSSGPIEVRASDSFSDPYGFAYVPVASALTVAGSISTVAVNATTAAFAINGLSAPILAANNFLRTGATVRLSKSGTTMTGTFTLTSGYDTGTVTVTSATGGSTSGTGWTLTILSDFAFIRTSCATSTQCVAFTKTLDGWLVSGREFGNPNDGAVDLGLYGGVAFVRSWGQCARDEGNNGLPQGWQPSISDPYAPYGTAQEAYDNDGFYMDLEGDAGEVKVSRSGLTFYLRCTSSSGATIGPFTYADTPRSLNRRTDTNYGDTQESGAPTVITIVCLTNNITFEGVSFTGTAGADGDGGNGAAGQDLTVTLIGCQNSSGATVTLVGGAGGNATGEDGSGDGYAGGNGGTTNAVLIDCVGISVSGTGGAGGAGYEGSNSTGANGSTGGTTGPVPIGQTSGFVAGSGTAVKSDSTFTGGSGSSTYTIGDIVRVLKQKKLLQ